MGEWDALREASKGRAAPIPRCARCKRPRVFNPCRDCASPAELRAQGAPPLDLSSTIPPPRVAEIPEELPPPRETLPPGVDPFDAMRATLASKQGVEP